MNISRTLLVLVIFLIFVIVGELIYLFYISPIQKSNVSDPRVSVKPKVSTAPTTSPSISTSPAPNSAISQDKIDSLTNLQVFKEGVLRKAILNYQVRGKIIDISKVMRKDDTGNDIEMNSVKIEGDESLNNTFFFSNEGLKSVEIKEKNSSDGVQIKFTDLKVGDTISIEYNIDLLDELNFDKNIRRIIITKE